MVEAVSPPPSRAAGISGIPLTGQDAELAGIQRIVAGTQSSTVYKPFKPEADAAAQLAVNLLEGKDIASLATTTLTSGSGDKVPSQLVPSVSVTKANVKDTVIKDGLWSASDICTAEFAKACKAAGISKTAGPPNGGRRTDLSGARPVHRPR